MLFVPQILAEMKKDAAAAAPAAPAKPAVAGQPAGPQPERPSAGQLAVVLVVVLGIALSLPIIVGFQQPIGLLIVGFALYEAWKINRRVPLAITGPHPIGDRPTPQGVPGHA